jgi:hypothetical protein
MQDQYHTTRRSILRKAVTTTTVGGLAIGSFAGSAIASKNSTLRINGLSAEYGNESYYSIWVDDKYGKAGNDTESDDTVNQDTDPYGNSRWNSCPGNTAFEGSVIEGGTDTFHYNGSILEINIAGKAEIEVDNDRSSSRNDQEGEIHVYEEYDDSYRYEYEFCMTDAVSPDCSVDSEDSTSAQCADGSVNGGSDLYNAAGEISVFRIYGRIEVDHYYEQEPSCWDDDDDWNYDC